PTRFVGSGIGFGEGEPAPHAPNDKFSSEMTVVGAGTFSAAACPPFAAAAPFPAVPFPSRLCSADVARQGASRRCRPLAERVGDTERSTLSAWVSLSPVPAVTGQQLVRLRRPPGTCWILGHGIAAAFPSLLDGGDHAPGQLHHVRPLKQGGVAEHAFVQ